MDITINWLAVLAATIVGTIIAGIWYSKVFGDAWIKLTGVTKKDSKKAGKTPMVILVATNFVTAVVLAASTAVAVAYFKADSVLVALVTGLLLSVGLSVATLLQHNAFELKPAKLTVINGSYQAVLYLGMALIIGLWG